MCQIGAHIESNFMREESPNTPLPYGMEKGSR